MMVVVVVTDTVMDTVMDTEWLVTVIKTIQNKKRFLIFPLLIFIPRFVRKGSDSYKESTTHFARIKTVTRLARIKKVTRYTRKESDSYKETNSLRSYKVLLLALLVERKTHSVRINSTVIPVEYQCCTETSTSCRRCYQSSNCS